MATTRNLTFKNIQSLYDLKDWIRTNTKKFTNKDIPKENMLIIIDYLKETIRKSDLPNKSIWIKSLNNLIKRAEVSDE